LHRIRVAVRLENRAVYFQQDNRHCSRGPNPWPLDYRSFLL